MQLPTGHEEMFRPELMKPGSVPMWGPFQGESSWLAAPYIEQLNVPTVQLVRNPLDTVRSLVGIGMFEGGNPAEPYLAFAEEQLGMDLRSLPAVEAASTFIVEWSKLIERHNVPRFRVEDLKDPEVLGSLVQVLLKGVRPDRAKIIEATQNVPTDVNSRPRDESITWDDVTPELRDLAEAWGYAID